MAVDRRHPAYESAAEDWQTCRDVVAGSGAVKAAGTRYLPALDGQSGSQYDAYKARALFYGATARTVSGLVGEIFRKPVTIAAPDRFRPVLDNLDACGSPLDVVAKKIVSEVVTVGRCAVLVDVAGGDVPAPYLSIYSAESAVNWRTEIRNGRRVLTLVVLHEHVAAPDPADPFGMVEMEQYRVLRLASPGNGGSERYMVELWRRPQRPSNVDNWELVETIEPTRRGEPLRFIPMVFFGPSTLSPDIEKPPILDLCEANLSHYKSSADLEHGCHYTALPTAWVSGGFGGVQPESISELSIGAASAWMLDADAKCGFLEFSGAGLGALESRLAAKERLMAILGARLLEDQPAQAETAAAVALRHRGESSVLASIAQTASRGLTMALRMAADWLFIDLESVSVKLNSDFDPTGMTAADIVRLMQAWQGGAIGSRALHHQLAAGEALPPTMDFDAWEQDREESAGASLAILPRTAAE